MRSPLLRRSPIPCESPRKRAFFWGFLDFSPRLLISYIKRLFFYFRAVKVIPKAPERTFAADMMLGKLARWMRVLGFDVLYLNPVEDGRLIEISRREGRVLLTRDTRLVRRRGVAEYLLVTCNDPPAQLEEVIRAYPVFRERILSRCILCNRSLTPISREDARPFVPDYVYLAESKFGRCLSCQRVYWKGSHYRNMVRSCSSLLQDHE